MNEYANKAELPDLVTPNDLLRLELRVARRADKLAQLRGYDRAQDFWMRAEGEVLSRELEKVTVL